MSDPCREAFEKWAISQGMSIKRGTKNYTHAGTYMAWKGWNARPVAVASVPSAREIRNVMNNAALIKQDVAEAISMALTERARGE